MKYLYFLEYECQVLINSHSLSFTMKCPHHLSIAANTITAAKMAVIPQK